MKPPCDGLGAEANAGQQTLTIRVGVRHDHHGGLAKPSFDGTGDGTVAIANVKRHVAPIGEFDLNSVC